MKFLGTLISVSDIKKSRKFYEDVFGLKVAMDVGANLTFDCGLFLQQDYDKLLGIPKDKILKEPNNMEVYFEEEDLDSFMKILRKRSDIRYVHDVREYPWGQRVVRFYDPDGHIIEVGEDMKKVVERFLNSGLSKEQTAERMHISITDLEGFLNSLG